MVCCNRMNQRELSIILMIINMVIVWVVMGFVYTHIVLRFILGLILFFALYKVEYYLINRSSGSRRGIKIVRLSNSERLRRHKEKLEDYKNE